MLSYRHAFHAGNFTDVHKHVALVMLLEHLLRKDAPFCCLDTHAGAGVYDLDSRYAQRNREFETGIARLWGHGDCPAPVARYVDIVRGLNPPEADGTQRLRWYPGSTWIARTFLRPADRIVASELHSTDAPLLKQCFARDLQVSTVGSRQEVGREDVRGASRGQYPSGGHEYEPVAVVRRQIDIVQRSERPDRLLSRQAEEKR